MGRRRELQSSSTCEPRPGNSLPRPTAETADALNEPCYGGPCIGYSVCCVTIGSCTATTSSNVRYYEGGCVSADSSLGALPAGCVKQGECTVDFLEHNLGGTTQVGALTPLPAAVRDRQMAGSTGCSAVWQAPPPPPKPPPPPPQPPSPEAPLPPATPPPDGLPAGILIVVIAVPVTLLVVVVLYVTMCKKSKKPPIAAKDSMASGGEVMPGQMPRA